MAHGMNEVSKMNDEGWKLHFIHPDNSNLLITVLRLIILILTFGLWTIGSSELLIFEKSN